MRFCATHKHSHLLLFDEPFLAKDLVRDLLHLYSKFPIPDLLKEVLALHNILSVLHTLMGACLLGLFLLVKMHSPRCLISSTLSMSLFALINEPCVGLY